MAVTNTLVKFYRGLQANIPASGTPGAFYFATDTNRLYTALENGNVVPVNEGVRTVATVAALPEIASGGVPADAGQFYYITEANILAVHNGTEWVQINSIPGPADASKNGLMTSAQYTKLEGISAQANKTEISNTQAQGVTVATITIDGTATDIKVDAGANTTYEFTDGTNGFTVTPYDNGTAGTPVNVAVTPSIADATQSASGLMSASDKTKLDGVQAGATATSFTQTVTSGEELGTITINGTATKIYAPEDQDTTYTFAEGAIDGAFQVTPKGGQAQSIAIHGLGSAAYEDVSTGVADGDTGLVNGDQVHDYVASEITKLNLGTASTHNIGNGDNDIPTNATVDSKIATATAGLTGAMHFKGVKSEVPADGTDYDEGDVILVGQKEYVWTGSAWEELGNQGSYAYNTITVTGADGLAGGGSLEQNREITHAVPSGAAAGERNASGAAREYIKTITTDKFGHVTAITTGTETVVDTNTTYTIASGDANGQIKVTPSEGSAYNVDVTGLGSAAYKDTGAVAAGNAGLVTGDQVNTAVTSAIGALGDAAEKDVVALDGNDTSNLPTLNKVDNMISTAIGAISYDNYALKATTITAGDGLTGGGSLAENRTIAHEVPTGVTAGTLGTAGGRTYIQTIERDKFGHIISVTTGEETVVNTNTEYTFANGSGLGQFSVTPTGGTAQTVTVGGLGSAAAANVSSQGVAQNEAGLVSGGQVYSYVTDAIEDAAYQLPTATSSVLGGVKIGDSLQMNGENNDTLNIVWETF